MARSPITEVTTELQSDSGSVLWSLVQGEQLEFEVTLAFIENASSGYVYEAVIMEAENILGDGSIPSTARVGGVHSELNVRVLADRGAWSSAQGYNAEELTKYNNKFYKLLAGTNRVSAITPDIDPLWKEHIPNKVYLQFPESLTLSPAWSVQPTMTAQVHGFFELRVTEPTGGVFKQTWKPMRGVIEFLFSPTQMVP